VLSFSENNVTHKRALIDRKAILRVYLDYRGADIALIWGWQGFYDCA
jgi:hypothetical protein